MNEFYKHGFVKVASVSPELKVADCNYNAEKMVEFLKAIKPDVDFVLFPELSITSYTASDLFFNKDLLKNAIQNLIEIKKASFDFRGLIFCGLPIEIENKLFNASAVVQSGSILGIVLKSHLPNYSEFYEKRWFTEGSKNYQLDLSIENETIPCGNDLLFEIENLDLKFGIEICEDLWSVIPPSSYLSIAGAQIIFNPSASNELLGKSSYRRELVKNQSAKNIGAYVYAGSSSGESSNDLTYSGHLIIAENGLIKSESRMFNFDTNFIVADIDIQKIKNERIKNKTFSDSNNFHFRVIKTKINLAENQTLEEKPNRRPFVPNDNSLREDVCEEILEIQSTALAKRLKHIGTKNVTLGLSGGLDSTLALLVCIRAFDKLNLKSSGIHCLVMPGPGSSQKTQSNAQKLAKLFKTSLKVININNAVDNHLKDIEHTNHNYDITYENAQARERTQILMDYANKIHGIVIGTGDLSELALGWCTYNADQVSMYGVNSGVPKTLVKYLIEYEAKMNKNYDIKLILSEIINQPISPELIPPDKDGNISQNTEDRIGSYELNDFFLFYIYRYSFSIEKIYYLANLCFDELSDNDIIEALKQFINRFISNQFKRSLMPDGVKIGSVALSPRADWRMPSDASANIWRLEIEKIKAKINDTV